MIIEPQTRTRTSKCLWYLAFVSTGPADGRTPAKVTFTPYSRQMQLWPMTPSTSCPCPTSTPRRWRSTRCSATATSPGGSAAASWASSKRWGGLRWEGKTLLFFCHLSVIFWAVFEPFDWISIGMRPLVDQAVTVSIQAGQQRQLRAGYLPIRWIAVQHAKQSGRWETHQSSAAVTCVNSPVFITYFHGKSRL